MADDDPDIRDLLSVLFVSSLDVEVEVAGNGAEALQKIVGRPPHLLVTDYQMPQMNGVELIQAAHEKHPNLPIILLTAFPASEVFELAMQHGARHCIGKPFNPESLIKTVGSLL